MAKTPSKRSLRTSSQDERKGKQVDINQDRRRRRRSRTRRSSRTRRRRSMTRWLALSSSSTSPARRTHLPAQSGRSTSRSTVNAASKLPERRWIERCVDESFNQLTIGKHHIVVVKPRGTLRKTSTRGPREPGQQEHARLQQAQRWLVIVPGNMTTATKTRTTGRSYDG